MFYIGIQKWRGNVYMGAGMPDNGWKWKWAIGLLNLGIVGMTMALLVSGYDQAFVERAVGGSTWAAYFQAQLGTWYMQGMYWREIFGLVTTAGLVLLIWDLVTIGRQETRPMVLATDPT